MHYRDSSVSPEAIKGRQNLSRSVIGGEEVARVRGSRDVSGVTSGQLEQLPLAGCRPTPDLPAACQVTVIRMCLGFFLILFFFLKRCIYIYSNGD